MNYDNLSGFQKFAVHSTRMGAKMMLPFGGKALADAVAPLGSRTIVNSSIKPFDPNTAYNQSMGRYTSQDRQSFKLDSEKIEAPWEDAVVGVTQGAALAAGGALTGNPLLIKMGLERGMQVVSNIGRKTEKSELERTLDTATLMLNNLDIFKKKAPAEDSDGGIGSSVEGVVERKGSDNRRNNAFDRYVNRNSFELNSDEINSAKSLINTQQPIRQITKSQNTGFSQNIGLPNLKGINMGFNISGVGTENSIDDYVKSINQIQPM